MKRILMVIAQYYPVVGGAEIQAKRISEYLVKKGFSVSVITVKKNPDLKSFEEINGVKVYRLKFLKIPKVGKYILLIYEFFFLLFSDYIRIDHLKKIDQSDLIDIIVNSNDYDELKQNISMQLTDFKSDIQTTITNTSNVNLAFPYPPPPDDQLPDLEQRIRSAISEVLQEEGIVGPSTITEDIFEINDDVKENFSYDYLRYF